MFIGREKELGLLKDQLLSNKTSIVLIYGKKRMGKSSLITEASKDFDGTVINHLCVKSTYEGNLQHLYKSVSIMFGREEESFNSLNDMFDYLKAQEKNILLILDEYEYFKDSRKKDEVDAIFSNIISTLPANIKIILCGSYIPSMTELLNEKSSLYGSFTLTLRIDELDYLDASQFYPQLSLRDKIRFYSVFGGSPYVLSNLDYSKTLDENILNLLLDQNSILRTYIENVVLNEIQKNFDIRILEILSSSKKRYKEILNSLCMTDTGLLDKQLKNLINMETIEKTFPINKKNDKKKQFYEIKENLMMFYFTFIFGNDPLISKFGKTTFYVNKIRENLDNFIQNRLCVIVRQFFTRQLKKGSLSHIEDIGYYWYEGREDDLSFATVVKQNDKYDFCVTLYRDDKVKFDECEKIANELLSLKGLECNSIGFITSSLFSFRTDKYPLLTAKDIYSI